MTKRARLTTQAVIDALHSDEEDDFEVDDPEEPFMEGSDDEFSDLEDVKEDDEDEDNDNTPPHSPQSSSPPSSPTPSTSNSNAPPKWSSTLKPVTISPFVSSVGPTVTIPDSPREVFELFFTPDLLQTIMDENNRYSTLCFTNAIGMVQMLH